MGFAQWIRETFRPPKDEGSPFSEIIGRVDYAHTQAYYRIRPSIDTTEPDYEWYDKFRRGKQQGYEIGGLFAEPIAEIIASWALSDGFNVEVESEATQEALKKFSENALQFLVDTAEDSYALGDAYLLVQADGTLRKVSPEQVKITRDELDFEKILSIQICTQNDTLSIEDTYTPESRTVKITRGGITNEQTFPNLIGLIPIIPFFNERGANETNGHPYIEAMLTLFAEYDDVMRTGVDGVKLMGHPTPVVSGVKDAAKARQANATYSTTYVDRQGTTQTEYVTELDKVGIYYTGENSDFHYASPGSFTDNTTDMLKKLFYVMLQHAKIPEWVWGGAISSSMASVEAQAPAFVKFIEGQRRKLAQPIRQLLQVYLKTIALFTPGIQAEAEFTIEWPELMPIDKALLLQWVMYLQEKGIVTKETALRLADVVKDVQGEIEKAQSEKKADEKRAMQNAMAVGANGLRQDIRAGNTANGNNARQRQDPNENRNEAPAL